MFILHSKTCPILQILLTIRFSLSAHNWGFNSFHCLEQYLPHSKDPILRRAIQALKFELMPVPSLNSFLSLHLLQISKRLMPVPRLKMESNMIPPNFPNTGTPRVGSLASNLIFCRAHCRVQNQSCQKWAVRRTQICAERALIQWEKMTVRGTMVRSNVCVISIAMLIE